MKITIYELTTSSQVQFEIALTFMDIMSRKGTER